MDAKSITFRTSSQIFRSSSLGATFSSSWPPKMQRFCFNCMELPTISPVGLLSPALCCFHSWLLWEASFQLPSPVPTSVSPSHFELTSSFMLSGVPLDSPVFIRCACSGGGSELSEGRDSVLLQCQASITWGPQ